MPLRAHPDGLVTVTPRLIVPLQSKGKDDYFKLLITPTSLSDQLAQEPGLVMVIYLSAEMMTHRQSPRSRVNNPMAIANSLEPRIRLSAYKWSAMEQYLTPLLAEALINTAQVFGTLWIQDRCIVQARKAAGDRQCLHPEAEDIPTTLKRNGLRGDRGRVRVSSAATENSEDFL
jgi:hypothetical protein